MLRCPVKTRFSPAKIRRRLGFFRVQAGAPFSGFDWRFGGFFVARGQVYVFLDEVGALSSEF